MTHDKLCNAPGHDTYMHAAPTPTTSRLSPRDANNTSHQQRLGRHPVMPTTHHNHLNWI